MARGRKPIAYRIHRPVIPPELLATPPDTATLDMVKRWHVARVITRCGGNQKQAAAELGIGRSAIREMLYRYQLLRRPTPTNPTLKLEALE